MKENKKRDACSHNIMKNNSAQCEKIKKQIKKRHSVAENIKRSNLKKLDLLGKLPSIYI